MEPIPYLVEILVALIGAAAGVLGTLRTTKNTRTKQLDERIEQMFLERRNDFNQLLDSQQEISKQQKLELEELRLRVDELQSELQSTRENLLEAQREIAMLRTEKQAILHQFQFLEAVHLDLPTPQWIVNNEGKMMFVNAAYEEAFLTPNGKTGVDYAGKSHIEFWGPEIGAVYAHNDQHVLQKKHPITFQEKVVVAGKEISEEWLFMKYPLYSGRALLGLAGIGFRVSIVDK